MKIKRKTKGLLFNFSVMFLAFTIIILIVVGLTTYFTQLNIYKRQCEQNIRNIGEYLEIMMANDGEDFITYQNYYMDHFDEVNIPYDFDEYQTALDHFWELYEKEYPGQAFGTDVKFADLSPEVKEAYFIYFHEYWLLAFENAREAFHIPYSYYLVMKPDIYDVVYMIDGERTKKIVDGDEYLYLGDEYYNDPKKYKILWDTWFSKTKQNGYMEFDNSWGHTYGYYTPLTINGQTLGIIATEIDVATVNHDILYNTLYQLLAIAAILIVSMVIMLIIINRIFVTRTKHLENDVHQYSLNKDVSIAEEITSEFQGDDELSSLGQQFATMIITLDEHMKNLIKTKNDLRSTQQKMEEMGELANKDALTGIRNKNAYDKEVQKIEWELEAGEEQFGVVMIDLNYLKRINDTYGHDKGNAAIKQLCAIVCEVFRHSPVFRIGGDEFAVILKGQDYQNIEKLVDTFNKEIEEGSRNQNLDYWERISAAIGYALYDKEKDNNFNSVFRRADSAMYLRKKEMKATRGE